MPYEIFYSGLKLSQKNFKGMHCKLTLLFFLLLSCSNNKKINSSDNSKNTRFHFLPVEISYTGVALEDSMKYFISGYFQSKNIEVIDKGYGRMLVTNEIRRAGALITSKEPEERMKELARNEQYVYNSLELNFKSDANSQQIDMGWSVIPWPQDFTRLIKRKWTYLQNHKISNSPLQDELKTLCDSIIYSKSLY
jgi:hypothetical protein